MKQVLVTLCCLFCLSLFAQEKTHALGKQDPKKETLIAEAACGQCQLGLPGKRCDLAIRIHGKAYFVEGIHIDSLGDAHAKDGFCNAIRKARVQGRVVNNRFQASYFALEPEKKK